MLPCLPVRCVQLSYWAEVRHGVLGSAVPGCSYDANRAPHLMASAPEDGVRSRGLHI